MSSAANCQILEPSPDDLAEGNALRHATRMAYSTAEKDPRPISGHEPAIDRRTTSAILTPPPSPVSTMTSQYASPRGLPSTSNVGVQPARADMAEKKQPPSEGHALKEAGLWSRLVADWWILELAAAFVSLAAIASIVGILVGYDQKPVPPLFKDVTLNAVISFLATISRTAIMMSVGTALSQRKWLWFKEQRSLSDLQNVENASRGPLGSMKMLFSLRGGIAAYLAALVTVGALGFEPFIQQLLSTQYRVLHVAGTGIQISSASSMTNNISEAFDNSDSNIKIIAAMVADVQREAQPPNGQERFLDRRATPQLPNINVASQSSTSALKATCPSGNCVWPNYYTLDTCARCQDTTKSTSLKHLSPDAAKFADFVSASRQKTYYDLNKFFSSTYLWEILPREGNSVTVNSSIFASAEYDSNSVLVRIDYSGAMVHRVVWPLNLLYVPDVYLDFGAWTQQSFADVKGPALALGYAELESNPDTGLHI